MTKMSLPAFAARKPRSGLQAYSLSTLPSLR